MGVTQCDGDGVQICATVDGCPDWTDVTSCSGDETCHNGQCIDACEGGADCEVGSSQWSRS